MACGRSSTSFPNTSALMNFLARPPNAWLSSGQSIQANRIRSSSRSVANLTEPKQQKIVTELCTQKNAKLRILDNLSCLFSGLKENDADSWELVLNWLLDFRRRRIAVLIVHHSSKSGSMRGTYRREDAAFWVIRVDPVKDRGPNDLGARFQTAFEKQRNSAEQEW